MTDESDAGRRLRFALADFKYGDFTYSDAADRWMALTQDSEKALIAAQRTIEQKSNEVQNLHKENYRLRRTIEELREQVAALTERLDEGLMERVRKALPPNQLGIEEHEELLRDLLAWYEGG